MKKHVRFARIEGGALGIGGIVTAAPDLVALLWLQSRMVWYIAAAYGYDPNHPMRPAEYLALQGLYDTPAHAREALDGVGKRLAFAMAEKPLTGRRPEMLHMRLAKYVARRIGAPLRRPVDPVHRRADRRDAERQRHRPARPARTRLLRRRGAPARASVTVSVVPVSVVTVCAATRARPEHRRHVTHRRVARAHGRQAETMLDRGHDRRRVVLRAVHDELAADPRCDRQRRDARAGAPGVVRP